MIFKSRKELYQFSHGTKTWYFTSDAKKVTYGGIEYLPIKGLKRGNIEDADIDKCEVDVIFPHPYQLLNVQGQEFTQVFLNKIYFESVYLTILELYQDQTLVLFKGRVTQPKFDDDAHEMTLVCSTAESYQRRNILTRKFQKSCPNKIYDRFCGLVFTDWAVEATVTAISGLDVTFNLSGGSKPLGYFTRGLLKKDGVFTFVLDNTSTALKVRLYRQHIGLQVGDVVQLAPGCDQSLSLCNSRFSNHLRYAGYPNMPSENPVNNQIIK